MNKYLLITLMTFWALMANAIMPAATYTIADDAGSLTGDVNCDGSINAADVTALYNYILNGDQTYLSTSDVNNDGAVNAGDVTAVYNIILGGSQPTTSITMNEYVDATAPNSTPTPHVWQNYTYGGQDVIYITIDGVEENMYRLYRSNNKWCLADVTNSSKAGFGTRGTIKAIWVRNAYISTDKVYKIQIPYDYALGSGTYTCNGTTVALNLNLELAESRVEFTGTYKGSMDDLTFCNHYNEVNDINRMCNGYRDEFTCMGSSISPVVNLNNHLYVFGNNTDVNSNNYTQLHATIAGGQSYALNTRYYIGPGMYYTANTPLETGNNSWTRDITLKFYSTEDGTTHYIKPGGQAPSFTLTVGSEISLIPMEGGRTITNGITTARYSSNYDVVDLSDNSYHSTICLAKKVGTSVVQINYVTPSSEVFNFYFALYVEPTVWIAGKRNGSPVLLRNNYVQYTNFGTDITKIDRVFVKKGHAYLKGDDASTSYILRSTNPHYHGSFAKRTTANMDHLLVTNNEDIFYVRTDKTVIRNNAQIYTASHTVGDIVEDESTGHVFLTMTNTGAGGSIKGLLTEFVGATPYEHTMAPFNTTITIGNSNGETAIASVSPHFRRMFAQDGVIYIDATEDVESCWRPQDGGAYQWSYRKYGDATVTYDSQNGFLRRCTRNFNNSQYAFYYNSCIFYSNGFSFNAYYPATGADVIIDLPVPTSDIRVARYYNGKIYAVNYNKIYIINPDITNYKTYEFSNALDQINDVYLETSLE